MVTLVARVIRELMLEPLCPVLLGLMIAHATVEFKATPCPAGASYSPIGLRHLRARYRDALRAPVPWRNVVHRLYPHARVDAGNDLTDALARF